MKKTPTAAAVILSTIDPRAASNELEYRALRARWNKVLRIVFLVLILAIAVLFYYLKPHDPLNQPWQYWGATISGLLGLGLVFGTGCPVGFKSTKMVQFCIWQRRSAVLREVEGFRELCIWLDQGNSIESIVRGSEQEQHLNKIRARYNTLCRLTPRPTQRLAEPSACP